MFDRIQSSVLRTAETEAKIAKVRGHYGQAVTPHAVLSRATVLGLDVLAAKPELLVTNTEGK